MQIKNLTMSFGTQILFENVNINIPDNEKISVVGVNGAGKSTLFKIIMGLEYPSAGEVILKRGSRINWLPQVVTDDIENTDINVLDYLLLARPIDELNSKLQNLYNELATPNCNQNKIFKEINKVQKELDYWDQYNAEAVLLKIIDGMNIHDDVLNKRIKELSGGQKSKVAFAKLLYSKPEVILLDEPTNHLDKESKNYVINYLKDYNGTVLVISHDVDFLNQVTTKTLFLDKRTHRLELFDGNYDKFKKLEAEREANFLKQAQIQEREEKKLQEIVNKYATSSGKRKRMAQDREKKLERLKKQKIQILDRNKTINFNVIMNQEESKQPLKITDLSFKYDKRASKNIINHLYFELTAGEKFLIIGENGVGKSTLLKLIMGILKPDSGEIKFGNKTNLGYYAQELELLDNETSIIDNLSNLGFNQNQLRNILSKFLFFGDDIYKKVSILSPGERSRVALAKISLSGANMLLLDEPTNHLDPETQELIAQVFKNYAGAMIVVSHNVQFVNNLGIERLLILPEGKIVYYDQKIVEHYESLEEAK